MYLYLKNVLQAYGSDSENTLASEGWIETLLGPDFLYENPI